MIDVVSDGTGAREVEVGMAQELPPALPVLPLRETVPFPDTLTPRSSTTCSPATGCS
jgi:hypothetical protein